MATAGQLHRAWRALPAGQVTDVTGDGCCLVLAPHPDDESLGCGGLIAACCARRQPPVVAILTDGSMSHPGSKSYPPARMASLRETETRTATRILGLADDRLIFLRCTDLEAPHAGPMFVSIVEHLAAVIRQFGCTAILAPWRLDPHCDHEAASLAAAAAATETGIRHLEYPVWGWTLPADSPIGDVTPRGWRIDIAEFVAAKRAAIAAHASQDSDLIKDDPSGFRLPESLTAQLQEPWETYLLP